MAEPTVPEAAAQGRTDAGLAAFLARPAEMVASLGSRLAPGLVPGPALRWAESIAGMLPPVFDAFGFEAHLGRCTADFALRLDLGPRSARLLARAFDREGALHAAPSLPGWAALRATARDLSGSDSRLRGRLSGLWVTYERPEEPLQPALHACLDAAHVVHGASETLDPAGVLRVQAALSRLRETWLPDTPEDGYPLASWRRLAGFLAGRGRLAHVSYAPARGHEAWKASLMIRSSALPDFLREAGWRGDRGLPASMAERFCPAGEFLRTGLTLGTGCERRIGLELFSGAWPEDGTERRRVLDLLTAMDLCAPAERDALLAWQGVFLEGDPLSGRLFLAARKWYAKVVLDSDGAMSCKAYLTWIPAARGTPC